MEFTVTAFNGDAIQIDGENWVMALGKALTLFGVDPGALERITCSTRTDGAVLVEAPGGRASWTVRPGIEAHGAVHGEPAPSDPGVRPGAVALSGIAGSPDERSISWDDRLFELNMDLATADPDEACDLALDALLSHVLAQAGGIARRDPSARVLTFVAARGPVADQLLHRRIGPDSGLVGLCFDRQRTLLVQDAHAGVRHTERLGRRAGLDARAVLCVPILGPGGQALGVLQLVDPPDRVFTEAHVAAAEQVSASLASAFARG